MVLHCFGISQELRSLLQHSLICIQNASTLIELHSSSNLSILPMQFGSSLHSSSVIIAFSLILSLLAVSILTSILI